MIFHISLKSFRKYSFFYNQITHQCLQSTEICCHIFHKHKFAAINSKRTGNNAFIVPLTNHDRDRFPLFVIGREGIQSNLRKGGGGDGNPLLVQAISRKTANSYFERERYYENIALLQGNTFTITGSIHYFISEIFSLCNLTFTE